jgi:hypothetical protein
MTVKNKSKMTTAQAVKHIVKKYAEAHVQYYAGKLKTAKKVNERFESICNELMNNGFKYEEVSDLLEKAQKKTEKMTDKQLRTLAAK